MNFLRKDYMKQPFWAPTVQRRQCRLALAGHILFACTAIITIVLSLLTTENIQSATTSNGSCDPPPCTVGPCTVTPVPSAADISNYADELSKSYRVPSIVIKAIIEQESGWNPNAFNSCDGGVGLMQVTPPAPPYDCSMLTVGIIDISVPDGANPFTIRYSTIKDVDWNKLCTEWEYNMQIGVQILLAKVLESQSDYLDLRILENWYYPIAYYNGGAVWNGSNSDSNDPINPIYTRNPLLNTDWKSKYNPPIFPYQECVYNIIRQDPDGPPSGYVIPADHALFFGQGIQAIMPGPSAVESGAGHYAYLYAPFGFPQYAEFYDDGTAKVGPPPGEIYTGVGIHIIPFGPSGSFGSIKAISKASGAPLANVPITINNEPVGVTDQTGFCYLQGSPLCGEQSVGAVAGILHFFGLVDFACGDRGNSKSNSKFKSQDDSNTYVIPLVSDGTCSGSAQNNFVPGDRVEVYGTGDGLRARYPDPCTDPPLAVMPDLSSGTIISVPPICCDGYFRWQIRYDSLPTVNVWSAEGEPSTGQLFLRKKSISTCSYSLAPGRLDLSTSGAAASGFNVDTEASCYWTAVSNLDWIAITTNGSGNGPAQVTFSVSENDTPYSRTGNIIVGDQTFIITQPGDGNSTGGWGLNVASLNPNSGVNITVSPNDTGGQGSGVTPFTRNYNAYTQVFLTAPAGIGSTTFQKWQRDGLDWSTSTDTNLTMEGNHTMTAAYVPIPDFYVAVFISPQQAIDEGAKWYLQGNGPYDSGYSLGPLAPGTYPGLTFQAISGWVAPPDQSFVITNSGPTIVRVTYTVPPALSLSTNQIDIGSGSGGANLLVTNTGGGTLNWLASTTDNWITLELSSGAAAAGASNPLSFSFSENDSSVSRTATITVSADGATGSPQTITVSQAPNETGSLQVNLQPPEAVTAGAKWQVDGGQFMDSGAVVSGLATGSHTVSFNTVGGFITPDPQPVTIVANQTLGFTGSYVAVIPDDFNGDGKTDFALFNTTTRRTALWYLSNNVFIGSAFGPTLPSGWKLTDAADFNGDGKPDYLLVNSTTRRTAIWYLNGPSFLNSAYGPTITTGWTLMAAADFNRDGHPDYLLYNATTRRTAVWYLNNNLYTGSAYGPTISTGYVFAADADFNSDGQVDLALFNPTTLKTAIWYLSGVTYTGSAWGPTIASGYQLVAAADFNSDSKPDYVLYNSTTRRTALWYLNNNIYLSSAYGPTLALGYILAAP